MAPSAGLLVVLAAVVVVLGLAVVVVAIVTNTPVGFDMQIRVPHFVARMRLRTKRR